MEDNDLFVRAEAIESLKALRGRRRQRVRAFLEHLAEHPFIKPDSEFEDRKQRIVSRFQRSGSPPVQPSPALTMLAWTGLPCVGLTGLAFSPEYLTR